MMPELSGHILVISVSFAPSPQVGGKRFTFLAPILEAKGLDVHILTAKNNPSYNLDKTLPISGTIHRTRSVLPYPIRVDNIVKRAYRRLLESYLNLPDPYIWWLVPGVCKALKIIRKHDIALIVATAPPYTPMVMGAILSRLTGAKLILDYRDPWTSHRWKQLFKGKFKRWASIWLEKRVVRQASALVFVTDIMQRNFQRALGCFTEAPSYMITNGFNRERRIQTRSLTPGKTNILYAGAFYGERRLSLITDPLVELIEGGYIAHDDVEIHVFGNVPKDDREKIAANGLTDVVKQHEPVDHFTLLGYMKGADILFLPSGADVIYALPFKVFDYLSVERPILAVAPENSAVAEMMETVDCGEFATIHDLDATRRALLDMLVRKRSYSYEGSTQYSWERIGELYVRVIKEQIGYKHERERHDVEPKR